MKIELNLESFQGSFLFELKGGKKLLYIFDSNEQLQTILKPDGQNNTTIIQDYTQLATMFTGGEEKVIVEGPCPYKEAPHLEQINGEHTFTFWVPADHPDSQYVKEENFVAFKDEDGDIRLFVIKELDEVHEDTLYKEAFCQAAWIDELNDEPIEDLRPQDKTAAEALTSALQGKRWQPGTVAELGLNSTNFYYENAVSAIKKIINTWGGELKDRIVLTDNKITGRFIDILPRRGADTGKRFEITKDIQSLKRTILSYPKTAMYGRGKGLETDAGGYSRKITFANVVWSKANGDPADKPLGQEWIGDPDALAQYGRLNSDGSKRHRFGFFEASDEEDPANLLQSTWNDLQVKKKPVVQYELKVIDLENVPGFEHEKVRLGDTNFIIDRFFSPAILVEARVIEIKRYLNEPERTEIKLGNFIDDILDYNKKLEQVEATVNDNKGVWSAPIADTDWPDDIPPVPSNIVADGLLRSISLTWDFDPSSYIAAYEVYGSQVHGFTADASNLLFRGKSGGYVLAGDINQTWYFRMRAVNTHGTPSALSGEVSGATRSIVAADITPLIITNEMIAGDAKIDFAKIANVQITNAMIADAAISSAKILDLDAAKLKANTVIANNITFTGKLSGVTGDFSGTVTSKDINNNKSALSNGAVSTQNSSGTKLSNIFDSVITLTDKDNNVTTTLGTDLNFARYTTGDMMGYISVGDKSISIVAGLDRSHIRLLDTEIELSGHTTVTSNLDVTGTIINGGFDFILGNSNQSSRGNSGASRALVKDGGNVLVINYAGDFSAQRLGANLTYLATGTCKIDVTGNTARWQQSDSNYIAQGSDGSINFYMGGTYKHVFYTNGTKTGGSIDIDGKWLGMSPIDSPQVLIEYIEFDLPLSIEGTKVFIDERYVKATENFAVFPNNGKVIEKGINYFVISGEGLADCRIVGERRDYADAFWADMSIPMDVRETA